MKTSLLVCALALIYAASPAAAQFNGQASTADTTVPAQTISIGDQAAADAAIENRLDGIFSQLDGLDTIRVSVRSGVVTLTGKVQEEQLATRAEDLADRVADVVAVKNEVSVETSVSERLVPVYDRIEGRAAQAASYLPLILVALLFWMLVSLLGFYIAARSWPWSRIAPNGFIADLLRQIVRIVFMVVGGVLALDILGATALLGTLLGAAGIFGLAVGFAVRDTVENYIASILLSVRQPFRPKDFVKIDDFEGFVISLTSRATILMEVDGNHIRIPNATVFKSAITNYTVNPQRRFTFEVGVNADSDLDRALQIGLAAVARQEFILDDPPADAWIEELGESNVVLTFVGWIDQKSTNWFKARSEAMRMVKNALETNGYSLPEPIYRLRFDDGDLQQALAGAAGAPEPRTAEPPRRQPEPETPQNTDVDTALLRRMDRERRTKGRGDLLNENAPNEFGDDEA
ncbi:mechanosensitive ion channel family protein [Martelella limonii]|uniref:mechanosensitive ion channel family protein n=1 Tax=Martelella limonii TaxID=1647649 RepID=UPI0015801241|nr:mechanosensitive ion channel family protein [Martelella limonii]